MLRQIFSRSLLRQTINYSVGCPRHFSQFNGDSGSNKDEKLLKEDLLELNVIHFDEIDEIMSEQALQPISYYPKVGIEQASNERPLEGHRLMVIQPWAAYANFGENTDPDMALEECVSLGNTIHNWSVVGKKLILAHSLHRKQVLPVRAFAELKESILDQPNITGCLFGVELLSGVQLATLERELKMPVYDRFTIVLNIFRQHARTKEAKIQVALAELPYIRSHLREIHESSEYSSSSESLKTLIGGAGEKFYRQRLDILKKREARLKYLLQQIRDQRDKTKRLRIKKQFPVISVVGYTNSGKTSLIKYLTEDERLIPKDQLFATLDVTVHQGQLPSNKTVLYLDTVGFIARIPMLLIEAFSATLRDVQESDLILHILDVSHPDHRLQQATVIKALESLRIPKNLLQTTLTVGNKIDKLDPDRAKAGDLPKCDLHISVTENKNLDKLVEKLNQGLMTNLKHSIIKFKVENGGIQYNWLRKNGSILDCEADKDDGNYLICRVVLSPAAIGRWHKLYGTESILSD